jgi:hypothetical protein
MAKIGIAAAGGMKTQEDLHAAAECNALNHFEKKGKEETTGSRTPAECNDLIYLGKKGKEETAC